MSGFGRQIEKTRLVWEGSAGESVCWGGERGGVKLLEFEDFAVEHSVKGSARRSEGGGRFIGFASCRRPPNSKTLADGTLLLVRLVGFGGGQQDINI